MNRTVLWKHKPYTVYDSSGPPPFTPPANTILTSQDLLNGAWFNLGLSSLLKNAQDQFGTANSAYTATCAAGAGQKVQFGGTGGLYTKFGCFGKAGTIKFFCVATSGTQYVVFDVQAGTVALQAAGCTGTITQAPNGFWWCDTTTPASASSAELLIADTAAHAVPGVGFTAAGGETLIMYNPSARA